jgi:hypothetical protein
VANQSTCGQGLAENSVIPAKLGELSASMAQILEVHMEALDLEDEDAKKEHGVYVKLVKEQREAAAQLMAIAEQMAGSRDLPMGRHDQNAMSSATVVEAFENFVMVEQQLLTLLQQRVEQDRGMLGEIRRAAGSRNQ